MTQCAYTIVSDQYYYPVGTHIFANSFKRFHPDIDLVIFRQDMVDKVFKEKGINFYQAKPYFAELLMHKYDLVVNIDADTIILDRLVEVFDNVDYEIGSVANENEYENASVENVTEDMYLQAGLVASTSKDFWLKWQEANKEAMKYLRKENDTLNLLVYNDLKDMKLKMFDKDKEYYGCKSLGGEPLFTVKDGKTYYKDELVRAYHFARGGVMPKLDIPNMPLKSDVKELWTKIAYEGQSITIKGL